MALCVNPTLVIADEPTSALDATIQLQIADLLARLVDDTGVTLVLITHDIRLVRYLCDDLVVLRAGAVVERGPVATLDAPSHDYTQLLVRATG
jgi:ABC-type dipeptide/oligopeptide/nickel transport system ATPase component